MHLISEQEDNGKNNYIVYDSKDAQNQNKIGTSKNRSENTRLISVHWEIFHKIIKIEIGPTKNLKNGCQRVIKWLKRIKKKTPQSIPSR